jgi:hypothetical protein
VHTTQEGEDLGEGFSASMRVPSTGMANIGTQLGGGGGAAVMEKQGLNLSQSEVVSKAKTDDTGGGGNNGKNINNGGGGDGDDGDDDDYFDDDDEEVRVFLSRSSTSKKNTPTEMPFLRPHALPLGGWEMHRR